MKTVKILLSVVFFLLLSVSLYACAYTEPIGTDDAEEEVIDFERVYSYAEELGYTGTLEELIEAFKGDNAYDIAVKNGYEGTETEWLLTLVGERGDSPRIGNNGTWWIGNDDTGVQVDGLGYDYYPLDDGSYYIGIGTNIRLSFVVIPDTFNGNEINGIEDEGFLYSKNLVSIEIPKSIQYIGKNAFPTTLNRVIYKGSCAEWKDIVIEEGNEALLNAEITFELGHLYGGSVTEKLPTCTEEGEDVFTCSICGDRIVEYTPKLNHTLTYELGLAPTCTVDGYADYCHCTREGCDYTTFEVIPALGHDIVNHPSHSADCLGPGCAEYESCTRCDYTTYTPTETAPHTLTTVPAKDPTCTEIGWTEYEYCTVCDYSTYTEIPATGHTAVSYPAKEVSCTESGWNAYIYCSLCEYTDIEEIPPLGHATVYHAALAPTCTENGHSEYYTCSRCDYTTCEEISARGHSLNTCPAKAPTCVTIGWEEYEYCTVCDYTTYVELPRTSHTLATVEAKDPTCTESGWDEYEYCIYCNYSTYTELPAIGHTLTHHDGQEPTCTTSGYEEYDECTICGYSTYSALPATDHVIWTDGTCLNCHVDILSSHPYLEMLCTEDGKVQVTGLTDESVSEIVIPDYVSIISAYAFQNNENIYSVTISASVTTINPHAFRECINLYSVSIYSISVSQTLQEHPCLLDYASVLYLPENATPSSYISSLFSPDVDSDVEGMVRYVRKT